MNPVSIKPNVLRCLLVACLFAFAFTPQLLFAQAGAALNFDGTNDFVSVNTGYTGGNSVTYEAWVRPTTLGLGYRSIIMNNNFASPGNVHFQFDGGRLLFAVSGSADYYSNFVFTPGNWYHVAATYTNAGGGKVRLYVNGIARDSAFTVTPPSIATGEPFRIGSWAGDPARQFIGDIDEVRIWDTERTAAEIAGNMNCEVQPQAGLQLVYHFNQGIAGGNNGGTTSLTDGSGNGRTGTLNNFTLNGTTSNWVAPGGVTSGTSCPVPAVGDYRTTNSTNWTTVSFWERYNGTAWVAATNPPSNADGVINIRTGHTVTITTAVFADQIIVDPGATLAISGGTLTVPDFPGVDFICNGTFNLSSGTLTGIGQTSVNFGGTFNWTGGNMDGQGSFTTQAGSTVATSGASAKTLNTFRVFNNASTNFTVTGSDITIGDSATLDNSGTISLNGNFGFAGTGSGVPVLHNSGTIVKTAGAGTSNIGTGAAGGGIKFTNDGAVNASTGTVSVFFENSPVASSHTGSFDVSSGATLTFIGGGGTQTFTSTGSFTGSGNITFGPSSTTIDPGFSFGSNLIVSITNGGHTWNNNATINSLTITSGGMSGSGVYNVSNSFNWSGAGTSGGTGAINILAGATATVSGSTAKNLAGSRILNNASSDFTFGGTGNIILQGTSSFINSGTVNITGDVGFVRASNSGTGINNIGTILKSAGSGTSNIAIYGSTFTNAGSINVNTGTLSITPYSIATTAASGNSSTATLTFAFTSPAPFTIGQTITVSGVVPVAYNGTFTITNATTTTISYASAATGAQSVAGNISVIPSSISLGGTYSIAAGATLTGSIPQIFTGSGIINDGSITVTSLTMGGSSAQTLSGAGSIATLLMNNATGLNLNSDHTISNTITFSNGIINTGLNKLILAPGASVARSSGHVNGTLQRTFTGSTTQFFDIGDAINYLPVSN